MTSNTIKPTYIYFNSKIKHLKLLLENLEMGDCGSKTFDDAHFREFSDEKGQNEDRDGNQDVFVRQFSEKFGPSEDVDVEVDNALLRPAQNTVDDSSYNSYRKLLLAKIAAQKTKQVEKRKKQDGENLLMLPDSASTIDKHKPLLKTVIGTTKIHPSAGYNFSQNAIFEASQLDNITANNSMTETGLTNSRIINN